MTGYWENEQDVRPGQGNVRVRVRARERERREKKRERKQKTIFPPVISAPVGSNKRLIACGDEATSDVPFEL
jgi:hypothetical protein